jgi:hypothetical protein
MFALPMPKRNTRVTILLVALAAIPACAAELAQTAADPAEIPAEVPAGPPLEVRFQPADFVYLWENNGEGAPLELYTAVLQNVAVVNRTTGPVTLDEMTLSALSGDEVVQTVTVDVEALEAAAVQFYALQHQKVLETYDFHFQVSRYLKDVPLAGTRTLKAGEAVIVTQRALLFQSVPDTLRVSVVGRAEGDTFVSGSGTVRVVNHESQNAYGFPVSGRWLVAAAPSLHGHHRWASIQEFALDLVRLGDGGLSHRGEGIELDQYYGYGAAVIAVADGTVAAASDGMEESNADLQQGDESDRAYFGRTLELQQKLLSKGFAATMGNHVSIEHANGEFSHYLHLKNGSVAVEVGDRVERGQRIGALGHSGNSTEPHLHFHLSDGASLDYSRGIPIEFDDIRIWPAGNEDVRHLQSGTIVESGATDEQAQPETP